MKLSKKGEYAIRAIVALGTNHPRRLQIQEIAQAENIPQKFLEQVLLILKNSGYLQSYRGQQGGYTLRKKPEEITLGEIVRLIDGSLAPIGCASRTSPTKCEECRYPTEQCWLRGIMLDVRDAISDVLDKITFQDILKRVPQKESPDAEMYYI